MKVLSHALYCPALAGAHPSPQKAVTQGRKGQVLDNVQRCLLYFLLSDGISSWQHQTVSSPTNWGTSELQINNPVQQGLAAP